MSDGNLSVRLVSPEEEVFSGDASGVVVPAWDGEVGILPGHAPMMTLLGHGELAIDLPGGGSHRFHVAAGVMKVEGDELTILTEYVGDGPPEELPPGAVIHPDDVTEDAAGGYPPV